SLAQPWPWQGEPQEPRPPTHHPGPGRRHRLGPARKDPPGRRARPSARDLPARAEPRERKQEASRAAREAGASPPRAPTPPRASSPGKEAQNSPERLQTGGFGRSGAFLGATLRVVAMQRLSVAVPG